MNIKHSWLLLIIPFLLFPISSNATTYYIDGVHGSDRNEGTSDSPWRSLEWAREYAIAGATVLVREANYPTFKETSDWRRTTYLRFFAAPGHKPVLDGIDLIYTNPTSAYISFDGFKVSSKRRNRLININNAKDVKIQNGEIFAEKWARQGRGVTGIWIGGSSHISVHGNRMYEVHRAIQVARSNDVRITRNYITPSGGTAIQYLAGNKKGLIEANHITGAIFVPYPQYLDAVRSPHSSIISLRSGDVLIRRNVLQGMGSTSGIMTYKPDRAGGKTAYSNVVIENNAIFSINNNYALRIYNLGKDFMIKDNIIFSRVRPGKCSGVSCYTPLRYNTAIALHDISNEAMASDLHIFNNILIGALLAPRGISQGHNVIWSWKCEDGWVSSSEIKNSKIFVWKKHISSHYPKIFENGSFFVDPIDFGSKIELSQFRLAEKSSIATFYDSLLQAQKRLGYLDDTGFLKNNWASLIIPSPSPDGVESNR